VKEKMFNWFPSVDW